MIRRREFITLIVGAIAWPAVARAQRRERLRRIGVLIGFGEGDPEGQARLVAFRQELQALGWTDGGNVHIDYRRYVGDADRIRATAADLVGQTPDVILAIGQLTVGALRRETRSIPIVFTQVSNPIGAGFVASMSRPGGNITGFTSFELAIGGKWLQALKEIAPGVTRSAVILNPDNAAAGGFLGAIEAAAPSLSLQVSPVVFARCLCAGTRQHGARY
jgi:putative ABC transport system substrate-binding protein